MESREQVKWAKRIAVIIYRCKKNFSHLKPLPFCNSSDIHILPWNKMADTYGRSNRKKSILSHWKLPQLPFHGHTLSSKMTHFGLSQMFLLFLSTPNLATTIQLIVKPITEFYRKNFPRRLTNIFSSTYQVRMVISCISPIKVSPTTWWG